ncbi:MULTISPECIES: hypothetical protein [Peribacillus]|nr:MULTISPECIES: hypothetical protein [Peribacillus]MDF1999851.1 hypothetical protein [Peribacillus frigoritolerans]
MNLFRKVLVFARLCLVSVTIGVGEILGDIEPDVDIVIPIDPHH